jgi:hypothetical protein
MSWRNLFERIQLLRDRYLSQPRPAFPALWRLGSRLARRRRSADDRREPRRSIKPELTQLETRFIPNDVLSIISGGSLLGGLALMGGLPTPLHTLLSGWGNGLASGVAPPVAADQPASPPTAVLDAAFMSVLVTPWQPSPELPHGGGSPPQVGTDAANSVGSQPSLAGDVLANPLGNDWLNAADSLFGAPPVQYPAGAAQTTAGHDGGGGGAAFNAPTFNTLGGTGATPAASAAIGSPSSAVAQLQNVAITAPASAHSFGSAVAIADSALPGAMLTSDWLHSIRPPVMKGSVTTLSSSPNPSCPSGESRGSRKVSVRRIAWQ